MIISVITGATAVATKSLKEHLEAIPGKPSIDSLQKTAILGTPHVIRKVLQSETCSLSGGDQRWFKRSTREKRLVARDIIIITELISIQFLFNNVPNRQPNGQLQDEHNIRTQINEGQQTGHK